MIRVCKTVGTLPTKTSKSRITRFYKCLLCTASAYGIELNLARVDDFNFNDYTVNGLFFQNGEFVRKKISIAPIIDNTTPLSPSMVKSLKDYYIMRYRFGFTKPQQFELIEKNDKLRYLLIPTREINNILDLHMALDEFGGEILIKPIDGKKGDSIYTINYKGRFQLKSNEAIKSFDNKENFNNYFSSTMKRNYIAQRLVASKTEKEQPFDVRIHVIRIGHSNWFVHNYIRLGGEQKITSNISTGGYVLPAEWFLNENFGTVLSDEIRKELQFIAYELSSYYQKHVSFPIIDLGIDVGIEKINGSYSIKLFEINACPGYRFENVFEAVIELMKSYQFIDEMLLSNS